MTKLLFSTFEICAIIPMLFCYFGVAKGRFDLLFGGYSGLTAAFILAIVNSHFDSCINYVLIAILAILVQRAWRSLITIEIKDK